ncbi:MAG: response regulator [Acidobacteriota bacterium]
MNRKEIEKILIVDDDKDWRETIGDILKKQGYKILFAKNGRTSLKILKKENIDLIILDLRLPDISGMEVLEKAKNMLNPVKVIMISAYGNKTIKKRAKGAGVLEFMDKPFSEKRLSAIVMKAFKNGEKR